MSATSIFQLPGDVPAGQVEIRRRCNSRPQQFCTGRRLKRPLMSVEEFNALPRRRRGPQQGAERATMHHAEANVLLLLKCQRVNIIPPDG